MLLVVHAAADLEAMSSVLHAVADPDTGFADKKL